MKTYKVSLGKELDPQQKFGSQGELIVKKFEVLNEREEVIGTVVLDIAENNLITLHPILNKINQGYGQQLYQMISYTFKARVVEWGPHPISKTPQAENMWSALQRKGLTELYETDTDLFVRSILIQ